MSDAGYTIVSDREGVYHSAAYPLRFGHLNRLGDTYTYAHIRCTGKYDYYKIHKTGTVSCLTCLAVSEE